MADRNEDDVSFTGLFVLAPDATLFPATEVEAAERERMGCNEADFALSRAGSRSGSKVLDPQMAHVLNHLTQPARIVDAVLSVSARFGVDPETALDAILPGLTRLMSEGFVVRAEADVLHRHRALANGTTVGGSEIMSCLHAMDDGEVYQVRLQHGSLGALKLSRHGTALGSENVLNECRILERLSGPCVPRLLERGEFEGRPYLTVEWRRGSDVNTVASELRTLTIESRRRAQLDLCVAIAESYTWLHESGVVHGDVHEGNLLIDAEGRISVLDFGIARDLRDETCKPPRGAAGHAWEPEYAYAILAGDEPPPATTAGEQFILAALLFELLTGSPYADFSYESEKALRQIADDAPRSFAACGVEPWPEVESVLRRALSKSPRDRYPSTRAFADALWLPLRALKVRLTGRKRERVALRRRRFDAWITELASWSGAPSIGVGRPPQASFAYGAAGVAYALLRLARHEDSPQLLAAADVWSEHAMWSARRDGREAFGGGQLENEGAVGPASLYFSRPGVHTVRALVGLARGNIHAIALAARALERSSLLDLSPFDLSVGKPGLLLASATLLESIPANARGQAPRLLALGDRLAAEMWDAVRELPELGQAPQLQSLGVAHGWAGMIYATLRWNQASHYPMPNGCAERLQQLAALAEPSGRGMRFPWRSEHDTPTQNAADQRYMAGWCNGSAGFVHVWLAAAESLDGEFRELAEQCAWHAWEDNSADDLTLCCGVVGRAYALVAWYRDCGDATWLRRAWDLVAEVTTGLPRDTALDPALLKGHLSLALIERELDHPHFARMPLFEAEGWPVRVSLRRRLRKNG